MQPIWVADVDMLDIHTGKLAIYVATNRDENNYLNYYLTIFVVKSAFGELDS